MKHEKMKKLTVLAMLSAIAYVAVALLRFPVVLFLSYEPKDVVIAIGGFLYGPLAALGISLVVSFIEMLTISSTGWIGFVMNFLSSAAFAGTAALLYRKKRTQGSAIAGLFGGALLMTVLMLLWNYIITPLYMHTARADVAAMLVPGVPAVQPAQGLPERHDHRAALQARRAGTAPCAPAAAEQNARPHAGQAPSGRVARRAGRSGRVHRARSGPARNDLSLRGAADR